MLSPRLPQGRRSAWTVGTDCNCGWLATFCTPEPNLLVGQSDIRKFRQLHQRPGWTQISRALRATCLSPNFKKHFAKLSLRATHARTSRIRVCVLYPARSRGPVCVRTHNKTRCCETNDRVSRNSSSARSVPFERSPTAHLHHSLRHIFSHVYIIELYVPDVQILASQCLLAVPCSTATRQATYIHVSSPRVLAPRPSALPYIPL